MPKSLIRQFDRNIHPKRLKKVSYFIRKVLWTLLLFLCSLLFGVLGFMIIEGYSISDALYMTIITISTVGYGEVSPLSVGGKAFVSLLIVTNIGLFAYAISEFSRFFLDGEFRSMFSDLFIGRKIDVMKNHVIICGYGRYGKTVVDHLINQKQQCVVIESSREIVSDMRDYGQIIMMDGDATDEDVLIEAGIEHAKAVVTTLGQDADNVYVILTARQLNNNIKLISRANEARSKSKLERAGANHVLIPENLGGFYMASLITKPDIAEVFSDLSMSEHQKFKIVEVLVNNIPADMKNKSIQELGLISNSGTSIIGLRRGNNEYIVNPSASRNLEENSALIVLGDDEQISRFHELTKDFQFID